MDDRLAEESKCNDCDSRGESEQGMWRADIEAACQSGQSIPHISCRCRGHMGGSHREAHSEDMGRYQKQA